MSDDTIPKLMKFTHVARQLGCTTTSLFQYCKNFDIPVVQLSARKRALTEDSVRLLFARAQGLTDV